MEKIELSYINRYAHKLNDGDGDLGSITPKEREHLRALITKYELELRLVKLADEVTQAKLL